MRGAAALGTALAVWAGACAPPADPAEGDPVEQPCLLGDQAEAPDFARKLGCRRDFDALASEPLDASIPGARSVKFVIDRADGDALYFQNSRRYRIHWEFASKHLSGNGRPVVPPLARFNQAEYTAPDRRFLLGAVTYYEGPRVFALEIAPYDTASATMIARAYDLIAAAAWFGPALAFHPTSDAVEREALRLPGRVRQKSTADLFAAIDYQPLNLATATGKLRFVQAAELDRAYVSFRDIVVLDRVPNDIAVVAGIITEELQTPLSHVNVLSQNRRTPNMALRGAHGSARLRALEGKWVRLTVRAFDYALEEITAGEAEAWWEQHKPAAVQVPRLDEAERALREVRAMIDPQKPLREAIKAAIPAYGGKAAHYAALAGTDGVPVPKAFAVPVFYYRQFMAQNGFDARLDQLLADASFREEPRVRDKALEQLRDAMAQAPVDPGFEKLLMDRIAVELPGVPVRFRSSTNAEDLDGFTGAGLYTSRTGNEADPDKPVLRAVRKVWASVWRFRAFEERSYRSIDHRSVGMALLVHRAFPDEEANGVALTANPFDPSGLQPGFYVNVQAGEASVVEPAPGVKTDQFVFHFSMPGQPIVFLERSTLVARGSSVLTRGQTYRLGQALDAIHRRFFPAYGGEAASDGWYAMDVEFKFDGPPGQEPALVVKQARPHPGRGK